MTAKNQTMSCVTRSMVSNMQVKCSQRPLRDILLRHWLPFPNPVPHWAYTQLWTIHWISSIILYCFVTEVYLQPAQSCYLTHAVKWLGIELPFLNCKYDAINMKLPSLLSLVYYSSLMETIVDNYMFVIDRCLTWAGSHPFSCQFRLRNPSKEHSGFIQVRELTRSAVSASRHFSAATNTLMLGSRYRR